MIDFITLCDYVGTFAFAISGIRLASAKKFDWFGAYVVGVVTAVGGGTIRDVLLNATPFWMLQLSYLVISGLALLFVLVFRKYVVRLNNTFFIFDAIGLGLFAVVGIAKTLDTGAFCCGGYCQDARLRFPDVGGRCHGNDYRSIWWYDARYSD